MYVYERPFIHCLDSIFESNFYTRAHVDNATLEINPKGAKLRLADL